MSTGTYTLAEVSRAVLGHSLEYTTRERRSLARRQADVDTLVHLTLVRTLGLNAAAGGPVRVDLGNGHVMTCSVEDLAAGAPA